MKDFFLLPRYNSLSYWNATHFIQSVFRIWNTRKKGNFSPSIHLNPNLDLTKRCIETMKPVPLCWIIYKKHKGNPIFASTRHNFIISFHFFMTLLFLPLLYFGDSPSWKFSVQTWWTDRERVLDAWTMGPYDKQLIARQKEGEFYQLPSHNNPRDLPCNMPDVREIVRGLD